MESPLSFNATKRFREALLTKNLAPYNVGFKPQELSIKETANIDPGNIEDIGNIEEVKLYTKNKYGPEDVLGFGDFKDVNIDKGTETNKGKFQYYSSEPSITNEEAQLRASIKNQYLPEDGYTKLIDITDIQNIIENRGDYYTFISSVYNPYNILTELLPVGNNGTISQDSALAQIAATQLKTEFQYRIGEEIRQETIGRVNILDGLKDPFDAVAIATGNRSIIEPNYNISVPEGLIGKGLDFLSRISGVYTPYSWINGDYFETPKLQTSEQQASEGEGEFSEKGTLQKNNRKNASDLLLLNTGRGQFKRLFSNLSYSKFRPDYQNVKDNAPVGSYYLGSNILTVIDIVSPSTGLPTDSEGNKVVAPIYGYGAIGSEYENKEGSNNFKFGLNGDTFIIGSNQKTNSSYDSKRLQGGFIWSTDESIKMSKKNVKRGGDSAGGFELEDGFSSTPKSQSYQFTKGSILDDTQRLVKAADVLSGPEKLKHVGNAINQISKVFNDGTREMTKGSMVYKYIRKDNGTYEGTEYCRVFTKDRTYSQNSMLQKTEGAVNHNRKFENSVFNNTFNINIAPDKGKDSTNISDGSVKKYMFSLENLAWRTSSRKGYTYQDLPVCERGPNGGRIMWFPPYDMKVSEANTANWTTNDFLGRPEPIYTYNNTTRQGSLSWKIVVDHPSILNLIVDKEMEKVSSTQEVNDIIDSFFAGCKTYDMYELAGIYPQFSPDDIYEILQEINTEEGIETFTNQVEKVRVKRIDPVIEPYQKQTEDKDYSYFFYFEHDVPGPKNATNATPEGTYLSHLQSYTGQLETYKEKNTTEDEKIAVTNFFNDFIYNIEDKTRELTTKIKTALDNNATVNIDMYGSASAPASEDYNATLSKRRLNSVKDYFYTFIDKEKYGDRFTITFNPQGENAEVYTPDNKGPYNCTKNFATRDEEIFSTTAMACRRVRINVQEKEPPPDPKKQQPSYEEETYYEDITTSVYTAQTTVTDTIEQRDDIAKRILRKLLSECSYFDAMKETDPIVYEGIKSKIKFFQPAFHSITPEGLNSRLTFLQQCLRPGDTIPVIDDDGKVKEGGIQNTAFGSPPICILRIGDFYHTKIAINQLSINYEPLQFDLNPEGIGIQPMIADVNMSFYFIGGQGLKAPVSRLQNAISFNYFGNTEMYDDRAVVTEDRSAIDNDLMKVIEEIQGFSVKDGQVERPEEAGNTIGEITTTKYTGQNLTGDTKFKTIMADMVNKAKSYAQNVISTLETISNEQSKISLAYFSKDRNYNSGYITGNLDGNNTFLINIFGKPQVQEYIDKLYTDLQLDITGNTNPFLKNISQYDFKNSDISIFKKNLTEFINSTRIDFETQLTSKIGDLDKNQLEMVRTIDKINLVLTETDGFRNSKGGNVILELTPSSNITPGSYGADTLEEMTNDMEIIGVDLQILYNKIFGTNGLINNSELYSGYLTDSFNTEEQTRFCTVSYKLMLSDPEKIKETLLKNGLKDKSEWVTYVNRIIYGLPEIPNNLPSILGSEGTNQPLVEGQPGLVDKYKELKVKSKVEINTFKNDIGVQKFTQYQPFNLDKERIFTYTQNIEGNNDPTKNDYFNKTYAGQNGGTLDKFNLKYNFK